MNLYRTDLAMERTLRHPAGISGVKVETTRHGQAETTYVRICSSQGAHLLGKPQGTYWTLTHPLLPTLTPEERMPLSDLIARELRRMLPDKGDILVLGLGNRNLTSDALGGKVVDGVLVTRHMPSSGLRSVCAFAPGVLGITGIETAEMVLGICERIHPAAVVVVDALAAMESSHICTTVQLTDTGIQPGSGVGNHRRAICRETLHIPVIALGIPMVVYASTIVRDALHRLLSGEMDEESADHMATQLTNGITGEMVVTPRDIDTLVAGLSDMLALAINAALHDEYTLEELSHLLH